MQSKEHHEQLQILLVDDNLVNQQVAKGVLSILKHSVELAGNGREAVEMAKAKDYDLLFMDIQMPLMDGLEATRTLREEGYTTPILAMTAHNQEEEKQRCLDAGMNGYVGKPFTPEDLIQAIDSYYHPGDDQGKEAAGSADKDAPQNSFIELPEELPPYNRQEMLDRAMGDDELIQELADHFITETPQQFEKLRQACVDEDEDQIRRVLHRMQGSVGNMSAKRMQELIISTKSEIAALSKEEHCIALLKQLEREFELYRQALDQK